VVLLSGHAYLDIDGQVEQLKPLDTTFIPPNVPHRFRNMSDTEPMKILWIYASPNATRTLIETGETRPVAAEHSK
jgi:mannose-6-phosphate isomerase-like protein (cupin superfamily)